jgi:hypothetical protein
VPEHNASQRIKIQRIPFDRAFHAHKSRQPAT